MVLAILRRELLGSGRKGRLFALRAGYVLLLAGITIPALLTTVAEVTGGGFHPTPHYTPPPPHAARGAEFTLYFGLFQLALVALVGPALASTAVTQDRASGVLELLAAAGTRAWQVVIGKIVSRTIWLGLCVLSGLPLLFAGTLMGGAGFQTVTLLASHSLAAALLGAAIGTLFSGAFRRPLPALLAAYSVQAAAYVVPLLLVVSLPAYPFHATLPWTTALRIISCGPVAIAFATGGQVPSWYAWMALVPPVSLAIAFGLGSIPFARHAPERTRRDAVADAGVALLEGSVTRALAAGKSLERASQPVGRNPIAWREARSHRYAFASRVLRLIWITLGGAAAVHLFAFAVLGDERSIARFGVGALSLGAAALTLAVSAMALAAEREAGTLELLRLTRLSSFEVAAGKLLGLARFLWPVIALPAIPALAFVGIDTPAFGASLALVAILVLAAASLGLLFTALFRRAAAALSAALGCVVAWTALAPFVAYWAPLGLHHKKGMLAIIHPLGSVTAIVQSFAPEPRDGWRYHSGHYHGDLSDFFELAPLGWLGVGLVALVGALALLLVVRRLERIA